MRVSTSFIGDEVYSGRLVGYPSTTPDKIRTVSIETAHSEVWFYAKTSEQARGLIVALRNAADALEVDIAAMPMERAVDPELVWDMAEVGDPAPPLSTEPLCGAFRGLLICMRREGHGGQHVATSDRVLAVWSNDVEAVAS